MIHFEIWIYYILSENDVRYGLSDFYLSIQNLSVDYSTKSNFRWSSSQSKRKTCNIDKEIKALLKNTHQSVITRNCFVDQQYTGKSDIILEDKFSTQQWFVLYCLQYSYNTKSNSMLTKVLTQFSSSSIYYVLNNYKQNFLSII